MKHTKGPWRVELNTCIEVWNQNTHICDLSGDHESHTEVNDLANARLIAAAPDMLEALEVALETLLEQPDLVGDADMSVRTIKSAIAKARGET